jgi:hypothetical protein
VETVEAGGKSIDGIAACEDIGLASWTGIRFVVITTASTDTHGRIIRHKDRCSSCFFEVCVALMLGESEGNEGRWFARMLSVERQC